MIDLKEELWAAQATKTARTVVLLAFASTAMLVGALLFERISFTRDNETAIKNVKSALVIANNILLADEKLTMSANLAAATGEPQWGQRYDTHLPTIHAAISTAIVLAPPEAADRFDQATRIANDSLVKMEAETFGLIAKQDLAGARAILSSVPYTEQKNILAKGTHTFLLELEHAADEYRRDLEKRSWVIFSTLIILALVSFIAMWKLLNRHLAQSELAFKAKQEEITRLALHDTLTGLPNRRYLYLQLPSMIAHARRIDANFALLLLDLDDFKQVNDKLGHSSGDIVLKEIGNRLAAYVRKDEFAARLGGDEFVVVLNHGGTKETALNVAERLVGVVREPIALPPNVANIGVSIGVSIFPIDATEPDDLIRKADAALYQAKENTNKNVVHFYQPKQSQLKTTNN